MVLKLYYQGSQFLAVSFFKEIGMLYVSLENQKQDIATVLLTLPKQLLKKKG